MGKNIKKSDRFLLDGTKLGDSSGTWYVWTQKSIIDAIWKQHRKATFLLPTARGN